MFERLKEITNKYNELNEELQDPNVSSDYTKTKVILKEINQLELPVRLYNEYLSNELELTELKNIDDEELKDFVNNEITTLEKRQETLIDELKFELIPKDEHDDKNIILEIRGAAGGDEANIFAGDLLRMYTYYAEKNNWKIETISEQLGTSGGFSFVEVLIKGENVYSKLKYESGSHRVQRIPTTETQGRVHTSTATVYVVPEVEDIEIDIKESDLKVDAHHSSGAGGQSVNTTMSAVRITHLPTNIVVTCQNERSQIKNKEQALKMLKMKLHDFYLQEQAQEQGTERKNKIGTGDRSEKIRTYNYPQNRVTDHRINLTLMDLSNIMDGELDKIINALINEDMRLKLEGEEL